MYVFKLCSVLNYDSAHVLATCVYLFASGYILIEQYTCFSISRLQLSQ